MVESSSDEILAGAKKSDVAFLVVGDPFGYKKPPPPPPQKKTLFPPTPRSLYILEPPPTLTLSYARANFKSPFKASTTPQSSPPLAPQASSSTISAKPSAWCSLPKAGNRHRSTIACAKIGKWACTRLSCSTSRSKSSLSRTSLEGGGYMSRRGS